MDFFERFVCAFESMASSLGRIADAEEAPISAPLAPVDVAPEPAPAAEKTGPYPANTDRSGWFKEAAKRGMVVSRKTRTETMIQQILAYDAEHPAAVPEELKSAPAPSPEQTAELSRAVANPVPLTPEPDPFDDPPAAPAPVTPAEPEVTLAMVRGALQKIQTSKGNDEVQRILKVVGRVIPRPDTGVPMLKDLQETMYPAVWKEASRG